MTTQSSLSPQPSVLSPQSSVLSPQPSVLSPQSSVLSPQSSVFFLHHRAPHLLIRRLVDDARRHALNAIANVVDARLRGGVIGEELVDRARLRFLETEQLLEHVEHSVRIESRRRHEADAEIVCLLLI